MTTSDDAQAGSAPELRPNGVDIGLAGAKALLSAVPGGGFVAELLSVVLPEQRADRMARYITSLAEQLALLRSDIDNLNPASLKGEQLALFEAGGVSASRATSAARIEQIARVVAQGLLAAELEAARARRLLSVLSELTDDDIVQMCAHVSPYKENEEWRKVHAEVLWTADYWKALKAKCTPDVEMRRLSAAVDLQIYRLISLGMLEETTQVDLGDFSARLEGYSQNFGLARYGSSPPAVQTEVADIRLSVAGEFVLEELGILKRAPSPSSGKE